MAKQLETVPFDPAAHLRRSPSLATLRRYAEAYGKKLTIVEENRGLREQIQNQLPVSDGSEA